MSHTAAELRERCKALELKGYGNKHQLTERIVAAEPSPSAETLASEAEAIAAAKATKPTPTCDWLPIGELCIPEMTVQVPGYLDGAVLERYEQLCVHAKRLHLTIPQTMAEEEALEFGTRRRKKQDESAAAAAATTEDVVPASEAALEWDEDEIIDGEEEWGCLLYTSPSPRDATLSRMPSSA